MGKFPDGGGAAWNTVEMASATMQCQNELIATTSVPYSNQVWAVGDYTSNCRNPNATLVIQPLIETNGANIDDVTLHNMLH